jgi:hypothetical protein
MNERHLFIAYASQQIRILLIALHPLGQLLFPILWVNYPTHLSEDNKRRNRDYEV